MKNFTLFVLLFACVVGNAQTLPIDFETAVSTSNFTDFDGGTATVIANPQSNGINTSGKVAQIVRSGGQIWAGSKIGLTSNLNFSTMNAISMKVFTTAPVGTVVKFKLEGIGSTERDVKTTVSNAWEVLTWDFTGAPANFNYIVFMFDFGMVGNGTANSTFLFDDIKQLFGGTQIDLPVTFEGSTVNYTVTDFGGNASSLVTDPTNSMNKVLKSIKTNQAATWAGTTIGTPGGFATNIPLTLSNSKMTVKVWSPTAGTPIRLKVEDSKDPTHTCETQTNTTKAAAWEVLEFDFSNEALGTAKLSFGLSMGWTYNMASIFFNFGTEGAAAGEKTYYFDDVKFGALILGTSNALLEVLQVFPNPSNSQWTVNAGKKQIALIELFDVQGKLVLVQRPNNTMVTVSAENLATGVYFSRITTEAGTGVVRLVKN